MSSSSGKFDWETGPPRILTVLKDSFPGRVDQELNTWADDLYDHWSTARAIEAIDRSNRTPAADITSLSSCLSALRRAEVHLASTGWHAGLALTPMAEKFNAQRNSAGRPVRSSINGARSEIGNLIEELASGIEVAITQIDPNGASVNTAFGDGPEFEKFGTKVTKSGAKFLSQECYRAFEALTDEDPAVRTNWDSGEAYGPFLKFVADIFDALEIEASAEAFAREARKELREKS